VAYSDKQWENAKGYYEAGLSLSQIKEKTGIARNTISQRAKKEHWKSASNAPYIEAKIKVQEEKGTILEQRGEKSLQIADEVADDLLRRQNLVYGFQERAVKKAGEILEITENAKDLKDLVDAVDKAAITLKVADRHAPKVEVNNTNAQQNNTPTQINIMRDDD
jgi:transcriptional regulator with XRE-family HTH domain